MCKVAAVAEVPLGQRMHAFGVVLHGSLPETRWLEFLHSVAASIGMSAVANPAVWTYPLQDKGGTGQTFVLPITESFLALDTWPDHSGAYLFVCSCKSFAGWKVDLVAAEFGLAWGKDDSTRFYRKLSLDQSAA